MLLLALACTPDNNISRQSHTDVFLQEPLSQVDILWVIDDSSSMAEEQERVANGFESFISTLDETNIDFHIGVVTTNMNLDNPDRARLLGKPAVITPDTPDYVEKFRERVQVGTGGADKEKGLSAGLTAVTEPLASGGNAGFIRDDAHLSIIFVSDENDCSDNEALANETSAACYEQQDKLIPVREFSQGFKAVKADPEYRVLVSAIVGPSVNQGCEDSWPGKRYQGVAEALGGEVGNICDDNYSLIMEELGLAVSGVMTTFALTYSAITETIEVTIDDELIEQDPDTGWTYDAANWMLRFDGDYVPPRGANISVSYEVAAAGDRPEDTATSE